MILCLLDANFKIIASNVNRINCRTNFCIANTKIIKKFLNFKENKI